MSKNTLIVSFIIILGLGAFGFYQFNSRGDDYPRACTAEAKICPDGSSVGRTGPNCEFTACPEESRDFGEPLTLHLNISGQTDYNGRAAFSDGLVINLREINDSRCPADVQCIWAGELSALLVISGGNLGTVSEEIRLGTVSNKTVTSKNYTFSLTSATESSVTIVVDKTN